jgi:hypothetical protein
MQQLGLQLTELRTKLLHHYDFICGGSVRVQDLLLLRIEFGVREDAFLVQ